MILAEGQEVPGHPLNLTCLVGTIPGLVVQPQVTWSRDTGASSNNGTAGSPDLLDVLTVVTGNRNALQFDALHTSDAGMYVCDAVVNISRASLIVQNSSTKQLPLQSECQQEPVHGLLVLVCSDS